MTTIRCRRFTVRGFTQNQIKNTLSESLRVEDYEGIIIKKENVSK